MRALLLASLLVGCGTPPPLTDGSPDGAACEDDRTLRTCADGVCEDATCREDETCSEAACIPWEEASLSVDFTLTHHATVARRVLVEVLPGGFPRTQVESLRFDFGDGVAGWGEALGHTYAEPGVYPVTLEVRLPGGRALRAERAAVIEPLDSHAPLFLTVNAIPAAYNGSRSFTGASGEERFTLSVPRSGFFIDATILDDPTDPVELESLSLTASVPVGERDAAAELISELTFEGREVRRASWRIETGDALPEGEATFTLRGSTEAGRDVASSVTVSAVTLRADRQPFDRPMVWLFRPDLDFFTTRSSDPGAASHELLSEPTPDGEPDFAQELALIGAQGGDAELDESYRTWILESIRTETYRYFEITPDGQPTDEIALTIFWENETDAPNAEDFAPDGTFSMMRFGGAFDGFVGFSGVSPYNEERIDDSTPDRGVASAGLLGILTSTPVISTRMTAIAPGVGQPIGSNPADPLVLASDYDPLAETDAELRARYDALRTIARTIGLVIASVTAHEMGHAMGLMPNGAPPSGFFGDRADASLVGAERTNPYHADLPGLNLMQAGGDYLGIVDEALLTIELPRGADLLQIAELLALENRFSPYARAYLQGRLTYEDPSSGGGGATVGCRRVSPWSASGI